MKDRIIVWTVAGVLAAGWATAQVYLNGELQGGGAGSGDITGVGDCATGACYQSEAQNNVIGRTAAGSGQLSAVAITAFEAALEGVLDLEDLQGSLTVPTQLNATGTPDATTYLRGDGAWATPSGGGSPGGSSGDLQMNDGAGGFAASGINDSGSLVTSDNPIAIGASPASTGLFRTPNNQFWYARNAADSADIKVLGLNTGNYLETGAFIQPNSDGLGIGRNANNGLRFYNLSRHTFFVAAQREWSVYNSKVQIPSDSQHTWASTTDSEGTADTGLGRASAAKVKITDGSTGDGDIQAAAFDWTGATTYTPTNGTTVRGFDADSTSLDELADVVATLIADLQTAELLN